MQKASGKKCNEAFHRESGKECNKAFYMESGKECSEAFCMESSKAFHRGFCIAWNKKLLPCILCTVLIVAIALFTSGCSGSKEGLSSADGQIENDQAEKPQEEKAVLGEGSTQFDFAVVDKEGSTAQFEIHTDKTTVGEALSELGLIDGEESGYGLYVTTVNGISLDYGKDGMYWAFYINDEYAQAGVDVTEITEGDSYSFKADKA